MRESGLSSGLSEIAVQTQGLVKRFGHVTALNDINIEVPSGTIYGFIGPSGCGKTTTVRCMIGNYRPTEGVVKVLDQTPENFSRDQRKQIGYMVLTVILAIILTALIVLGLQTPMLDSWAAYTVVILALLFTSLSLGFAISVISETDTQAVQYSMIVLLASIFFSGFFIALHQLADSVHIVSWLLPATYGTLLLQDLVLRGLAVPVPVLVGLIVYRLILFVFAWSRLGRKMRSV